MNHPVRSLRSFAAILCLSALALTSHAATLRLAAFNMKWLTATATETRMAPWKDEADLAAHRRALAEILAESVRADVLCVVEVTSRAALEKLTHEPALRKSGYRVLHVESEDTGTGQDVAFLVKPGVRIEAIDGLPIRRFEDTLRGRPGGMKRNDPRRARLTKHAVVCLAEPKICLMGLHLLAHPDDRGRTARRETQARIAADLIRAEIVARGYAPIVLGDFNDFDPDMEGPSEYKDKKRRVLATLKDFDPSRPGQELFNAAGRVEPPEDRWSVFWDKNRDGKKQAGEPVSLMDHILLDRSLSGRVVKAEILHAAHDGSVSDHWPVVVEIGN
jgi:endonuclease/exonuclease/phosphatase family metal-dependent hydrolase